LIFNAVVECTVCGELYDGEWTDDSDTVEDLTEPPVADQRCPGCGNRQEEEYPGWSSYGSAG
jgi:hypothetical protein